MNGSKNSLRWSLCCALVAAALAPGCKQSVDLSGRPCADQQCLEGYRCHPERNKCVPALSVGCEAAEDVCPAKIATGDPCAETGAFIPCRAGAPRDCSAGCRTCLGPDGWSRCSAPSCSLGKVNSCAACDHDCTQLPNVDTVSCVPQEGTFACRILSCAPGFENADGDAASGCEYPCTPTEPPLEICDGRDNDCDGVTDPPNTNDCTVYYRDRDGDGFASDDPNQQSMCACGPTGPFVTAKQGDCDDDPEGCGEACRPNRPAEICDPAGHDNNCNSVPDTAEVDAVDCTNYYPDADGDDYGDASAQPRCLCAATEAYPVANARDCNDDPNTGDAFNPDAAETCDDGIDSNCNGSDNDANAAGCKQFYLDRDGDGHGDPTAPSQCWCAPQGDYRASVADDCDDAPAACGAYCHPERRLELCDGYNNDCDTATPESCTLSPTDTRLQDYEMTALTVAVDGNGGENLVFGLEGATRPWAWLNLAEQQYYGPSSYPKAEAATDFAFALETLFIAQPTEGACDRTDNAQDACECGPVVLPGSRVCTDYMQGASNGVHTLVATPLQGGERLYFATPLAVGVAESTNGGGFAGRCEHRFEGESVQALAPAHVSNNSLLVGTSRQLWHCRGFGDCAPECTAHDIWPGAPDDIRVLQTYEEFDAAREAWTGQLVVLLGSGSRGAARLALDPTTGAPAIDSLQAWGPDSASILDSGVQAVSRYIVSGLRFWGTTQGLAVHEVHTDSWRTLDASVLPSVNVTALPAVLTRNRQLWVGTDAGMTELTLTE